MGTSRIARLDDFGLTRRTKEVVSVLERDIPTVLLEERGGHETPGPGEVDLDVRVSVSVRGHLTVTKSVVKNLRGELFLDFPIVSPAGEDSEVFSPRQPLSYLSKRVNYFLKKLFFLVGILDDDRTNVSEEQGIVLVTLFLLTLRGVRTSGVLEA